MLFGSVACDYNERVWRSHSAQPPKKSPIFLLVDHTGRARCLLSNLWLAKLAAKGEPQYENDSRAQTWRILSKISPVEQLHQGAVNTRSITVCLFLDQRTQFSFSQVFSRSAISVAPFPAWSYMILSVPIELVSTFDLVPPLLPQSTHCR